MFDLEQCKLCTGVTCTDISDTGVRVVNVNSSGKIENMSKGINSLQEPTRECPIRKAMLANDSTKQSK